MGVLVRSVQGFREDRRLQDWIHELCGVGDEALSVHKTRRAIEVAQVEVDGDDGSADLSDPSASSFSPSAENGEWPTMVYCQVNCGSPN